MGDEDKRSFNASVLSESYSRGIGRITGSRGSVAFDFEIAPEILADREKTWNSLFEKYSTETVYDDTELDINTFKPVQDDVDLYLSERDAPIRKCPAQVQFWVDTGLPPIKALDQEDYLSEEGSSLSEHELPEPIPSTTVVNAHNEWTNSDPVQVQLDVRRPCDTLVDQSDHCSEPSSYMSTQELSKFIPSSVLSTAQNVLRVNKSNAGIASSCSSVDTVAYILSNMNTTKKAETIAIMQGAKIGNMECDKQLSGCHSRVASPIKVFDRKDIESEELFQSKSCGADNNYNEPVNVTTTVVSEQYGSKLFSKEDDNRGMASILSPKSNLVKNNNNLEMPAKYINSYQNDIQSISQSELSTPSDKITGTRETFTGRPQSVHHEKVSNLVATNAEAPSDEELVNDSRMQETSICSTSTQNRIFSSSEKPLREKSSSPAISLVTHSSRNLQSRRKLYTSRNSPVDIVIPSYKGFHSLDISKHPALSGSYTEMQRSSRHRTQLKTRRKTRKTIQSLVTVREMSQENNANISLESNEQDYINDCNKSQDSITHFTNCTECSLSKCDKVLNPAAHSLMNSTQDFSVNNMEKNSPDKLGLSMKSRYHRDLHSTTKSLHSLLEGSETEKLSSHRYRTKLNVHTKAGRTIQSLEAFREMSQENNPNISLDSIEEDNIDDCDNSQASINNSTKCLDSPLSISDKVLKPAVDTLMNLSDFSVSSKEKKSPNKLTTSTQCRGYLTNLSRLQDTKVTLETTKELISEVGTIKNSGAESPSLSLSDISEVIESERIIDLKETSRHTLQNLEPIVILQQLPVELHKSAPHTPNDDENGSIFKASDDFSYETKESRAERMLRAKKNLYSTEFVSSSSSVSSCHCETLKIDGSDSDHSTIIFSKRLRIPKYNETKKRSVTKNRSKRVTDKKLGTASKYEYRVADSLMEDSSLNSLICSEHKNKEADETQLNKKLQTLWDSDQSTVSYVPVKDAKNKLKPATIARDSINLYPTVVLERLQLNSGSLSPRAKEKSKETATNDIIERSPRKLAAVALPHRLPLGDNYRSPNKTAKIKETLAIGETTNLMGLADILNELPVVKGPLCTPLKLNSQKRKINLGYREPLVKPHFPKVAKSNKTVFKTKLSVTSSDVDNSSHESLFHATDEASKEVHSLSNTSRKCQHSNETCHITMGSQKKLDFREPLVKPYFPKVAKSNKTVFKTKLSVTSSDEDDSSHESLFHATDEVSKEVHALYNTSRKCQDSNEICHVTIGSQTNLSFREPLVKQYFPKVAKSNKTVFKTKLSVTSSDEDDSFHKNLFHAMDEASKEDHALHNTSRKCQHSSEICHVAKDSQTNLDFGASLVKTCYPKAKSNKTIFKTKLSVTSSDEDDSSHKSLFHVMDEASKEVHALYNTSRKCQCSNEICHVTIGSQTFKNSDDSVELLSFNDPSRVTSQKTTNQRLTGIDLPYSDEDDGLTKLIKETRMKNKSKFGKQGSSSVGCEAKNLN